MAWSSYPKPIAPVFRNSKQAFDNAIQKGDLTSTRGSFKYAGNWMYMHSKNMGDEVPEVIDYFKNISTREYMQVLA